jgi:hypothetical protein
VEIALAFGGAQRTESARVTMALSTVASAIQRVIEAFANSGEVIRRARQKRRDKKKRRNDEKVHDRELKEREDELRLRKSLGRAPGDIRREYDMRVRELGGAFEEGDGKS